MEQMTKRELVDHAVKHVNEKIDALTLEQLEAFEQAVKKIPKKSKTSSKAKAIVRACKEYRENRELIIGLVAQLLSELGNEGKVDKLKDVAKLFGADANYTDGIQVV